MPETKSRFHFFRGEQHVRSHYGDRQSLRRRVVEGIKTFLFVAPLTVLIWVYAEREQQSKKPDVGVSVEVRTNQPDRIVNVVAPIDHRLVLDLSGPRAGLEAVSDSLSDRQKPLVLTLPEDVKPGFDGELNAMDQINSTDLFSRNAVTVTRVRPPLRVRVEAKGTRVVPIKQSPQSRIVGDVKFDPPTATIEAPASVLDRIKPEDMVLYADMSKFSTRAKGKYEDTVPLSFPVAAENLTFPQTVKVQVDMRESVPTQLQSIPVLVLVSARFLEADRFKVVVSQVTLPNVLISGPPDAIELIKQAKFSPAAILRLTPEEASTAGDNKTKRLTASDYVMPKDVTVTNPDREITYSVIDRGQ